MLKVILIRHGKTYGNMLGRYIGSRTDEPLCREGIRLLKEDVGGGVARTLLFDVGSGQGCIRSYGQKDIIF